MASRLKTYNEVLPIMIVKNAKYLGVTFDESPRGHTISQIDV